MRRGCRVAAAVSAAAVMALAGCGGEEPGPTDPLRRPPGHVYLYGTDGNMSNAIGDNISANHPGVLAGMKGTMPLTQLTRSFRDRVYQVDPTLNDFTYAGETYDAVVISALAAQAAGSTDPRAIAAQINGVTAGGTECSTPAQCLSLLKSGADIRYTGITLGLGGFVDAGEPSAATYGILRYGADNRLDDNLTQYVPAGDPSAVTQEAPPPGGGGASGPLRIGALLPKTGSLAVLGPPMFAGGELAVREINAAGGVLGRDVIWYEADDGTEDINVAKASLASLINQGVQVVIGAAASGTTERILPDAVQAGVVLFSPSNTADTFTTYDDQGLYFRTAPPDVLQANALADIIVRDGTRSLAIIHRDDSYGNGLAELTKQRLVAAGLRAEAITLTSYSVDPEPPTDFTQFGQAVRAQDPDGVLIISFGEAEYIIDALVRAGITSISN